MFYCALSEEKVNKFAAFSREPPMRKNHIWLVVLPTGGPISSFLNVRSSSQV
jgi:hypothetical protein